MNSAFEFFRRGGIVDFHWDVSLVRKAQEKIRFRTPMPNSGRNADYLSHILLMVHNGTNAETHHIDRRHVFRSRDISFWKWIKVFRIGNGDL